VTRVDPWLAPNKSSVSRLQTSGDLVDLPIADMCEVGKPPRRSKAATLSILKRDLGKERIDHLDRQKLIDYGKMRAEQGAGPVTLGCPAPCVRAADPGFLQYGFGNWRTHVGRLLWAVMIVILSAKCDRFPGMARVADGALCK